MAVVYATTDDVLARAGRLAPSFSITGERPDENDLAGLVDDVSSEISVALRGRGYDPAALDAETKDSFRDLAAYGVLARAYAGLPSDRVTKAAQDDAVRIWERGFGQIQDGSFPAVALLEAGVGGGGHRAGDFWLEEPTYGSVASVQGEVAALRDTNLAPAFERDMKL
ncbi:MAG: hypothetical protein M3540_07295 [Actinomycetota bacterium]|nr:hypothetical protein [Actinomycetota bacterium]